MSSLPVVTSLSVRAAKAAEMLGVSQRTLWQWTHDGLIPHVRIGGLLLYPVEAITKWLDDQANRPRTV